MHPSRTSRKLTSWIAIFAMLLGSLAPALTQALARGVDVDIQDICTASDRNGIEHADAGTTAPAHDGDHALGHCTWCSAHAPTIGLPPPPLDVLPRLALAGRSPHVLQLASVAPQTWSSAQPRAPPPVP